MSKPLEGNTDAARLSRLLGFLQLEPSNLPLTKEVALLAERLGEWSVLRAVVEDALGRWPDEPELGFRSGMCALQAQQFDAALQIFLQLWEQGLRADGVLHNIGLCLYFDARHDEALKWFRQIDLMAPANAASALYAARAMHHTESLEEAIALLSARAAAAPLSAELAGLLALLLFDADRLDDAQALAERVLADHPAQHDALLALGGACLERGDHARAKAVYERTVQQHPSSGRAWSGLGQIAFAAYRFDEALDALSAAVQHMPNHIGTWHLLGWTQLVLGDRMAAKQAFERAYALDHNFGESVAALAVMSILLGEHADVEKQLRVARRLAPGGMTVKYAEYLQKQMAGDPVAAENVIREVVQARFGHGLPQPDADAVERISRVGDHILGKRRQIH